MKRGALWVPFALVAVLATPASAQLSWLDFGTKCSPGTIRTCASFQASTQLYTAADGSQRTQLFIRVRNAGAILADGSTGGSILTRFGVLAPDLVDARAENAFGGASIFAEGGAFTMGDPASRWAEQSSINSLGSVSWALSTNSDGSPSEGGIKDCMGPDSNPSVFFQTCDAGVPAGWVTFALTAQGVIDPGNLQLAWGVVSVSDGTGEDLGSYQGTVTPEPATVILLASGLVGLGIAARRRRHSEVEGEDDSA